MRTGRDKPDTPSIDIRLGFGSQSYLLEWILFLLCAYILAYAADLSKEWFEGIMNAVTHLSAIPALWSGSMLMSQIGISVAVSVAYHVLLAVDRGSDLYTAFEQLDVGMSVALIANVLLVYVDHMSHVPITFIAVAAACFPQYNVYIAGFVILAGYPFTTLISYNGTGPFNMDKWILLALQIVSIVAFLLSDTYTYYSLHPIWHTASLLSIYYMIRIERTRSSTPATRVDVKEAVQFRF